MAFRSSVGSAWVALVLAACGGGVAALTSIVTPLGGSWSQALDDNETLQFNGGSDYFSATRAVTATVHSASGVCGDKGGAGGLGIELEGTLDNGDLSMHPTGAPGTACMVGHFADLARLRIQATGASPAIVYDNTRVDIGLSVGLWMSADGKVKLKFEDPDSVDNDVKAGVDGPDVDGCDLSGAGAVRFKGSMNGLDSATRADPFIPELRRADNNAVLYGRVEFVQGAELLLDTVAGDRVELQRKPDPANTVCPP